MTGSPLKKFLFTPIILSTAIFSALTLPLAFFGDQEVTIQLQEEPVHHGKVRDMAMPYLGLVSVLGLGTGIATIAVTGWRQSSKKSAQAEEQLSDLERHLQEKEQLLEELKQSKSRLAAAGLNNFLEKEGEQESGLLSENEDQPLVEETIKPEPEIVPPSENEPQPLVEETVKPQPALTPTVVTSEEQPISVPFTITKQPFYTQPTTTHPVSSQTASAKFASAQSFLGYQPKTSVPSASTVTPVGASDVEQLQVQLQNIMSQMIVMQAELQAAQKASQSQGHATEPRHSTSLKVIQSWSQHPQAVI
ncbi:MAG: hypothetical protein RIG63_14365 [Coleofasciculus chthonoplastes F3-SA18-01]|jgi:hypothetical protein|uniref:hypothetical protein n=1 Tax=Coleofasciculus chthonoplastes TaxID=64178 RepID=UPI0032FCAADC